MRKLYLVLAIASLILPYYSLVSFLVENGLDRQLFFDQPLARDISTFFAVDLIITAVVFLAFSYRESPKYQMGNRWASVVATFAVGPSFASPWYLYFRESLMKETNVKAT